MTNWSAAIASCRPTASVAPACRPSFRARLRAPATSSPAAARTPSNGAAAAVTPPVPPGAGGGPVGRGDDELAGGDRGLRADGVGGAGLPAELPCALARPGDQLARCRQDAVERCRGGRALGGPAGRQLGREPPRRPQVLD